MNIEGLGVYMTNTRQSGNPSLALNSLWMDVNHSEYINQQFQEPKPLCCCIRDARKKTEKEKSKLSLQVK